MKNGNKKITVVVDNSTTHPVPTNVRLVFLSPNTTPKTQPVDTGVIRCLKVHYGKKLSEMRLFAFEGKKEFKVNVLDAMKLLDQAWNSIFDTSIKNCFTKVCFAPSKLEENLETASESNNNTKEIENRLQAACLGSENFNCIEYVVGDADVITRETITENSIKDNLKAREHPAED